MNSTCEEYDMTISVNKTETMKVSRTPGTLNIDTNNTNLKQVKEFKYLGSIFTEDGRMSRKIENRIQKANSVSYQVAPLLKHSDILMEQNDKLHLRTNTHILMPNQDYDQASGAQITTCETRCLRKAFHKARRDMILNTKIREMVGTKSIHHHIQQQRIKWFGHLTRLPVQHPAHHAYNTRFNGSPRKTWINGVKETLL